MSSSPSLQDTIDARTLAILEDGGRRNGMFGVRSLSPACASLALARTIRKGDLINVLCGPMAGNVELVTADPVASYVSSPMFDYVGETVRIRTENGTVAHYHLCADAIAYRGWV